jgi:hypothetical protein
LFDALVVPTVVIVDWATAALTVMDEIVDFVVSATEVAVSETVEGLGTVAGAVYVTEVVVTLVRVPQAVPEQPVPERDQETPLLRVSFWRVAVKGDDWATWTVTVAGEMETEMGGAGATVMVELADFVESAADVARSVTAAGVGTVVGAV